MYLIKTTQVHVWKTVTRWYGEPVKMQVLSQEVCAGHEIPHFQDAPKSCLDRTKQTAAWAWFSCSVYANTALSPELLTRQLPQNGTLKPSALQPPLSLSRIHKVAVIGQCHEIDVSRYENNLCGLARAFTSHKRPSHTLYCNLSTHIKGTTKIKLRGRPQADLSYYFLGLSKKSVFWCRP